MDAASALVSWPDQLRNREKKDRHVVIIAPLEHQFANLCRAMSRPELAVDSRYRTNADRLTNLKKLVATVEGWLQSMPSRLR